MTSLLDHIRQPLIILLRSIIEYLEHSAHPTSTLDLSALEAQLPDSALPLFTPKDVKCLHCTRPSVICLCSTNHCYFHRTKHCRSQAA